MSNEFLDDLFGEHQGIVYSPIIVDRSEENPDGFFRQRFFSWPKQRERLEAHLSDYSNRDVYLSPVLFTEPRIAPETFKGTNYLWTEFDGATPSEFIEPTIRVSSSIEGHEHWYWRLSEFVTDKVLVEDYTRRIAYHYGADLSVWDYQNVLRPPNTWNHKRNRPVIIVSKQDTSYNSDQFAQLPIPAAGTKVDITLGELPAKDLILAKYSWKEDTFDLLTKEIEPGKRSDALTRLAYDCIEAGCSNEEAYVLLEDRDRVWGKYVGRSDRKKRLESFIVYVRSKKAKVAEIVQGAPEVYRFLDFMNTNIQLKWVIEGLLPVAGSMVIFGRPGVGKTTIALRIIEAIALGFEEFLGMQIKARQRTLFVSLEMQDYEVKEFFNDMDLSQEEKEALQEWFHIWPVGHAYPLDTPDQQIEFLKYIDMFKIETVVIDSHSLAMYGSISNDDDVKKLNAFLNEDVRKKRKCSYIIIHHPRKKSGIDDREMEQDDSFGSQFIVANAQTVIILEQKRNSSQLKLKFAKTRMSLPHKEILIERTPNRGFELVGSVSSTHAIGAVAPNEERNEESNKKPNDGSLGSLLSF